MSRWLAQQTDDGAHVLPIDDVVEHTESVECVCVPHVELMVDDSGNPTSLVTHHSLDGRETS